MVLWSHGSKPRNGLNVSSANSGAAILSDLKDRKSPSNRIVGRHPNSSGEATKRFYNKPQPRSCLKTAPQKKLLSGNIHESPLITGRTLRSSRSLIEPSTAGGIQESVVSRATSGSHHSQHSTASGLHRRSTKDNYSRECDSCHLTNLAASVQPSSSHYHHSIITTASLFYYLPQCSHWSCNACLWSGLPAGALTLPCPTCGTLYICPPFCESSIRMINPNQKMNHSTKSINPAARKRPPLSPTKTLDGADSGCETNTTIPAVLTNGQLPFGLDSISAGGGHGGRQCGQCGGTQTVRWVCSCCPYPICFLCAPKHRDNMEDKHGSRNDCTTNPSFDQKDHFLVEEESIMSDFLTSASGSNTNECSVHVGTELSLFCAHCEQAVCDHCIDQSYAHSSHVVVLVRDAMVHHQLTLRQLAVTLNSTVKNAQSSLVPTASLNSILNQLNQTIHDTAEKFDQPTMVLEKILDEIRTNCPSFSSIKASNETGTNQDQQNPSSKNTKQNANKSPDTTSLNLDSVQVMPMYLLTIDSLKKFTAKIERRIWLTELEVEGYAEGEGLERCCQSHLTTVFLHTTVNHPKNHSRSLRYRRSTNSVCNGSSGGGSSEFDDEFADEIVVEPANITVMIHSQTGRFLSTSSATSKIRPITDKLFELDYTLTEVGRFELTIKLYDQHIPGSPFQIECQSAQMFTTTSASTSSSNKSSSALHLNPSDGGCSLHSRNNKSQRNSQQQNENNNNNNVDNDFSGKSSTTSTAGSDHSTNASNTLPGRRSASRRTTPSLFESVSIPTAIGIIEDDLMMKVGVKSRCKGGFLNPQDVACVRPTGDEGDKDMRIIVTDSTSQNLQIFNGNTGLCTHLYASNTGRSNGSVRRPVGICSLDDGYGRIAVSDYDNRWVQVFETNPVNEPPRFRFKFGTGKMLGPKGLAVDRLGNIIVVDNKGSCVWVYSGKGRLVRTFGRRGRRPQDFAGPHYVAVNSENLLYITDFHHHSVKVFDTDGEFKFQFGTNGEGNGQFNAPTGIAIDSNDNVLVADWGNNRIQVFDSSGSFLSFVNAASDPVFGPQGICITSDGCLAVADSGNHCYKIYRYLT